MRSRVGLPPPNRNRLLPISIALLSGRNPRIRGFGWGRVGVGGRGVWRSRAALARPPPPTPPHKGEGSRKLGSLTRYAFFTIAATGMSAPLPVASSLDRRRTAH